jgi:hypothetical protein
MRVAVCFFGEIRGFPEVWENVYHKIVKPHNADVFMHHVYYTDDMPNTIGQNHPDFKEYYSTKGIHFKPPPILFELFKPVSLLLEKRPTYDLTRYHQIIEKANHTSTTPLQYHAIRNQAESRKKVLQLKQAYEKQNNFQYDVVIQTRLDLRVLGPLQLRMSPHLKTQYCGGVGKLFEQLIYGPSQLMDSIVNFYDEVEDLYYEMCTPTLSMMCNEHFMAQYFIRKGIHVENVFLPLDYSPHKNGLQRSEFDFYLSR